MLASCSSLSATSSRTAFTRLQLRKPTYLHSRLSHRPFASQPPSPPPPNTSPPDHPPPPSSAPGPTSTPSAPPPPREGEKGPTASVAPPSNITDLTTSSPPSSSSLTTGPQPSYGRWATLAETNDPDLPAHSFPQPALPPQPRNAPAYQTLRHTLPLEAIDVYRAPTLDPAIQPPPHFPPPHPHLFLSIRDSILPNKWRNNPLPPFPRPIVVPIYPAPVLKPSDPRPAGAEETIKYQPLSPEALGELYEKRITRRARADKQFDNWIHRMFDSWEKEPDDPEGWQGVRTKLAIPPTRADRPPSLMWRWEAMEEEDLWRWVMPMFYVAAAIPILGGAGIYFYDVVFLGRWEDEKGEFKWRAFD